MLKLIDHIGVAVPSIEQALKFWVDGLNLEVTHQEKVDSQKVNLAFLPIGDTNIELLEPTSDDSPIAKALEQRGPGLHHLCFEVDDIHAALDNLREQGFRLINEEPVKGAHGKLVAFIHPKSAGGIMIELSQKQ